MKYFFLILGLLIITVTGIFGLRGGKSAQPPIWLFPDMDNQDKLKAQSEEIFFHDGVGSRQPVAHTAPMGFSTEPSVQDIEFTKGTGYINTGAINDYFGNGLPKELGLTEKDMPAFMARGEERFNIYCAICHGESGDGQGVVAQYGVPGVANIHSFPREEYPDGRLYHVITHGKGNMSGYGYNIPLRDRWAIVAYIRALQTAQKAPLSDPAVKAALEASAN